MIALRKSGAAVTQGGVFLRKGGVLIEQEVFQRKSGALVLIHSPGGSFTADVPPSTYGGGAFNSPITITTESVTVSVTGGRAPFTYAWARTDAALGIWSIVSPAAGTTAFRASGIGVGDIEAAEFACTVTDANGSIVVTEAVIANVQNYGGLGGPIP